MPSTSEFPKSLAAWYQSYYQKLVSEATNSTHDITAPIRTALFYALRKWGFAPPKNKKLTQEFVQTGLELMEQVSVADFFKNAVQYQKQVFDELEVSYNSQRTYRMHLKKMLQYGSDQGWDRRPSKASSDYTCPRIRQGRGRAGDVRVSQRALTPSSPTFAYGLKDRRIPEDCKNELTSYLAEYFGSQNFIGFQLELQKYHKECELSSELKKCTQTILEDPKVSKELHHALSKFLKEHEIPFDLQLKLDDFHRFQSAPLAGRKRQDKSLRPVSARGHVDSVKRYLGWLHRYKQVPLHQLDLSTLVASSGLADNGQRDEAAIEEVFDFNEEFFIWLQNERKVCPNTELKFVEALVAVAKYLYHKESKRQSRRNITSDTRSGKRVSYRDIPIIEELRQWECEVMDRVKSSPPTSDISKKWVEWPVFKACVERLRQECAPAHHKKRRSETAVAQSYQICLIFSLLAAFPDRVRTVVELEVGRTLFKRDGHWVIEHTAADFKTGDSFCKNGELRIVPLPEELTALIDEWLDQRRAALNPQHSYVFTQKNGKPLTSTAAYNYFRKTAYRLTGQALNPHLVRTIIITHLKLIGSPDETLRALADLMAHSMESQQKIYDKRTSKQRVAPALKALQAQSVGVLPLK